MIEINVTKRIKTYRGTEALQVNATFPSRGITRIAGPSGVGKTTLLKIIAGLVLPEHGNIRVDGVSWFDAATKYSRSIQERQVGFVFQDYALFPNMTVEEHLRYGTRDEEYIEQLLSIGEMEPFRKNQPQRLSGGQQQRLAILRALSTKPAVLLMDEPFSALDEALKQRMMVRLKDLFAAQQTTVLLVTHYQHEVQEFGSCEFRLGHEDG
ncbi:molybdenum ABC transporter, ATP-binding protein [Pedobacter sp. BAL39]|uniref:ATP-binding cassette domain-containing protein n=1 Tax=Pedobacter sp. BAL39 TaxID=391596 RepID=UPI000155997F|nr:ATP-binding cassette domain-containing protein [Pedobacter sp. BAL39]EDM38620.1 molybdenum ABC transporter, ATP-binding protein [Pedobacter sp. BAL39]